MKKEIGKYILIIGGTFILLNIIFILIFLQINTSLLFQLLLVGISTTIFYSIKIAIAKKNNDAGFGHSFTCPKCGFTDIYEGQGSTAI